MKLFKRKSLEQILDEDLYLAEVDLMKNLGAAEYYAAQAEMLKQRVQRLRDQKSRQFSTTNEINIHVNPDQRRSQVSPGLRSNHDSLQQPTSSTLYGLATGRTG